MGTLGIAEILLILLIFLLLFGTGRGAALARSLGVAVRGFRSETNPGEEQNRPEGIRR